MVLQDELKNDPIGVGYSFMSDAEIMASLNATTRTRNVSRFVTARSILAECADGATILDKLEAASAFVSPVKWAMRFLAQEGGVDAGHPVTLELIGVLEKQGVLTSDEAMQLRNLSVEVCSRADELGIGHVYAETIWNARAGS